MSIGADLQTLSSGDSPYIELFEIQVNDTDFIYITNHLIGVGDLDSGSTNVIQFRDYDAPGTIRKYFPVPSEFDGIEHKSDGQFPQPTFMIANILRTAAADGQSDSLQALIGDLSYEDLLGFKVIRRRTLEKYLYGQSGDNNPPIELPRDIYYLDRIEDENPQTVTFTTVLPIDFTGVMLPKRNIIGNLCPWKYQGAGEDLNDWDKVGGCVWRGDGLLNVAGNDLRVYVNEDDEYIVDSDTSFTEYDSAATQGSFYWTTESGLTKIGATGTLTAATSKNYWQSLTGNDITPSDNSPNWRRVRIFTDFSGNPAVNVYTDDKYNDYFRNSNIVWKATGNSQTSAGAPAAGRLWERGDRCGKRISSCKARFQINPVVTLAVDSATNLKKGDIIVGQEEDGGGTGYIMEITGNVLSLAQVTGDFAVDEDISIVAPSWEADNEYDVGDRIFNGTKIYECTVKGLSASSGGPTHSSGTATDNTVTWRFISDEDITQAAGTLSITPSTYSSGSEKAVLPFGSFPTARVFQ